MARTVSITEEQIDKIYKLARSGVPKRLIVKALNISETTWYRCRRFAIDNQDLTEKQVSKLSKAKQMYWQLWQAFTRGQSEFIQEGFEKFSQSIDDKISWQFFKSILPELQEKPSFNKYDLYNYLMNDYNVEIADKVMKILIGAEEDE